MSIKLDVIEEPPNLTVNSISDNKSVNFGPGAEMLMHPNKQKSRPSTPANIDLSEINELDSIDIGIPTLSKKDVFNSISGISIPTSNLTDNIPIKLDSSPLDDNSLPKLNLKKEKTESADGFKSFNDIPLDPNVNVPKKKVLSREEMLKEKFQYLRKLEALERKGINLSKKYSMDSSLDEMKGEYEMIKTDREKENSKKFQAKMLMAVISGLEFLNNKFDPFDLKLDGWSEAVNENMDEYDEVFGELHEKYSSKAKIAPELKLLFMLGGSGLMLHMTNTMFKSSMPGMDDIMRQNPELMQQFTKAAVNTMRDDRPGFSSFMNDFVPDVPPPRRDPPRGSPPGPSQQQKSSPPKRVKLSSKRPDIDLASGKSGFSDAINMDNNFNEIRPEMKGPSDLGDILAGLKTKTINLKNQKDANSTVSISEIEELNSTNIQQKSKKPRKKKSDRNVMNLEI